jgi:1-acyl-sn-glycerol-3-phosphate acyltransferase
MNQDHGTPSAAPRGLLNAVFSVWTWSIILVMTTLTVCVQVALAILTWPFDRNRRITGRTLRVIGGVWATRLAPTWRFGVYGVPPKRLPARAVVVSNHESHTDPFLISRLPWEMKWLSKAELFKIPLVGWSMWFADDVPLRRGDKDSAQGAMGICRRKIENGMPVMIFPEGTRSKTEELLPFKSGAFRLAIQTGATVVPIAVYGTRQALPKHSWRVGISRALVTVGEPIPTQGMGEGDAEKLSALAREQIVRMREELKRVIDSAKP